MRGYRWFATVLVLVGGMPASAETYYVSKTGKDTNSGLSPAAAFRTISKAASLAGPGDIVYVGRGTYSECVSPAAAGEPGDPITFIADTTGEHLGLAPGLVTIQASASKPGIDVTTDHVVFEGFRVRRGALAVRWAGAEGGRLQSCRIQSSGTGVEVEASEVALQSCVVSSHSKHGLDVEGESRLTLTSCTISANRQFGLVMTGEGESSLVIDRCIIQTNRLGGLSIADIDAEISNSLVRRNKADGLVADGDELALEVVNCTFRANTGDGVQVDGGEATVTNCILTNSATGYGLRRSGGVLASAFNLFFSNKLGGTSGLSSTVGDSTADPKYISNKNERLQLASPAIDTGMHASAFIDLDGVPRPSGNALDRGCYEYSAQVPRGSVPYATDFEDATDSCWTNLTRSNLASLGNFSGVFGRRSNRQDIQTLRLTVEPGEEYSLFFDLYVFGAWEGASEASAAADVFEVFMDGETVFSSRLSTSSLDDSSMPFVPDAWGANQGYSKRADWIYRQVRVDFLADSSIVNISFRASGDESHSNESWALDNVRVVAAEEAQAYTRIFYDVAPDVGLDLRPSTTIHAAAGWHWADLDNNGTMDAVLTGEKASVALGRRSDGAIAFDVGSLGSIRRQGALLDFDNDGDLDFWGIHNSDSSSERLYMNQGAASPGSGPQTIFAADSHRGLYAPANNEGVAAADVNRDGWIDLTMFSENGNFIGINPGADEAELDVFEPPAMGLGAPGAWGNGDFVSSTDANDDGRTDYFYHYGNGTLLLSQDDGTYAPESASGIHVNIGNDAKMGSAWADFDTDGDMDLFVPDRSGLTAGSLLRNDGSGFSEIAEAAGIGEEFSQDSCAWGDYDNDGLLDLFVAGEGRNVLYHGEGGGTFAPVRTGCDGGERRAHDACFVDFDLDGDLDIAVAQEGWRAKLYENQNAVNQDRYLRVRVIGRGAGFTSACAGGVRVDLLDASGDTLLGRREIGGARGMGAGSFDAHFGGVNPDATYTVRVHFRHRPVDVAVVPSQVVSQAGGRELAQTLTVTEPEVTGRKRIIAWGEINQDEARQVREGVPLDQRGVAARRAGGRSLQHFINFMRRQGFGDERIRQILGGNSGMPLGVAPEDE